MVPGIPTYWLIVPREGDVNPRWLVGLTYNAMHEQGGTIELSAAANS